MWNVMWYWSWSNLVQIKWLPFCTSSVRITTIWVIWVYEKMVYQNKGLGPHICLENISWCYVSIQPDHRIFPFILEWSSSFDIYLIIFEKIDWWILLFPYPVGSLLTHFGSNLGKLWIQPNHFVIYSQIFF